MIKERGAFRGLGITQPFFYKRMDEMMLVAEDQREDIIFQGFFGLSDRKTNVLRLKAFGSYNFQPADPQKRTHAVFTSLRLDEEGRSESLDSAEGILAKVRLSRSG